MLDGDQVVNRADIGDHLGDAVDVSEPAKRRVRRLCRAMAAMVMGINMKTARAEEIGKSGIARRMLGEAVIDLDHGARSRLRVFDIEVKVGPGR